MPNSRAIPSMMAMVAAHLLIVQLVLASSLASSQQTTSTSSLFQAAGGGGSSSSSKTFLGQTSNQPSHSDDQLSRGKRANSIEAGRPLASNRAELEAEGEESSGDGSDPMEGLVSSASANEASGGRRGQLGNLAPTEMDAAQAVGAAANQRLHIVHLLAPEATQNATQNVTLDCMFKFDRKLDQRLTIKWFFNDELEPIYQWIPELNKRVYSDRYERFLDKEYEVSEDVDFMLQAYKRLLAGRDPIWADSEPAGAGEMAGGDTFGQVQSASDISAASLSANRRLLAGRLNRLAQLGGRHSRQLLDSLRAALNMDQAEYSRFRALRLIRPTTELSGRFTCSVSSLDGDDLRSTRLLVFEPAKSFTFNVSRISPQLYNLTCQAGQLFPRPTLALYRYRAGPLEQSNGGGGGLQLQHPHRPRLAATLLRQEPLANVQTQLVVSSRSPTFTSSQSEDGADSETQPSNEILPANAIGDMALQRDSRRRNNGDTQKRSALTYDIASWALVDESSLSGNVVTQFECLLTIEGTNYEQRQSLALQKGWHVNSAALSSRSTLLGLFSALASLLCLILALVSSMLIFKLLKRHAKNRVHQTKDRSSSADRSSSGARVTLAATSGARADEAANSSGSECNTASTTTGTAPLAKQSLVGGARLPVVTLTDDAQAAKNAKLDPPFAVRDAHEAHLSNNLSDGIYRVPEPTSTFGTRYIIGGGSERHHYATSNTNNNFTNRQLAQFNTSTYATPNHHQQQQQQTAGDGHQYSTKPLYC